MSTAVGVEAMV